MEHNSHIKGIHNVILKHYHMSDITLISRKICDKITYLLLYLVDFTHGINSNYYTVTVSKMLVGALYYSHIDQVNLMYFDYKM
jgi:hypothetical protein